jgi:1,2-diacylglycerol 3-alpha-glucosyltransferase
MAVRRRSNPICHDAQRHKVFLVCCGLGRINRGYETFTRECFAALKGSQEFDIMLYQGGWNLADGTKTVPSFCRTRFGARVLGNILRRDSYWVEQVSFALGLLPAIALHRPDIIYFSDGQLGNTLWHLRRLLGFSYRLLLSNGAPYSGPFARCDMTQQLSPTHYWKAINEAAEPSRQILLPYGFHATGGAMRPLLRRSMRRGLNSSYQSTERL